MRFVFVLGGRMFFRFVDGIVRQLATDGHQVELLVPQHPNLAIERCQEEHPNLTVHCFGEEPYIFKRFLSHVRHLRAYRHWLEPNHRWSDYLRRRWATTEFGFPRLLRGVVKLLGMERFDAWLRRLPIRPALEGLERWIRPNPRVVERLERLAPDLIICTPFVYPSPRRHTTEVEYLKAARSLGVPTAVVVASWDNLSMKGVFYIEPDWILVWNEIMRQEAQTFHHFPAERVFAVGAPLFDSWFERRYELPREEFLGLIGLSGDYLLYVESSAASGDEWPIVHRLAATLDEAGADPGLGVMVRRHPGRRDVWRPLEHPRLRLYPDKSEVPDTAEARTAFYNSVRHAHGVIGINTTVFVEAAILDRPCVALLVGDKGHFQQELVHFRYLLDAGFLELAAGPQELSERLLAIVRGEDRRKDARRSFVRSFVRPIDDGRTAGRVAADTLLGLAGAHPSGREPDRS